MVCLLGFQVMLSGIGLWWMLVKRLHYEGYEIRTPANFYMGILLFFQLPMCFFVGSSAGAAEIVKAAMAKKPEVDAKKLQQKLWWIDPTITGTAVMLAAGVGACTMRPIQKPRIIREAPVGVRDYVFEHQQRTVSERRRQTVVEQPEESEEYEDEELATEER